MQTHTSFGNPFVQSLVGTALLLTWSASFVGLTGCDPSSSQVSTDPSQQAVVVPAETRPLQNPSPVSDTPDATDTQEGLNSKLSGLLQQAKQTGSESADNAGAWLKGTLKNVSDSSQDMAADTADWANQTYQQLKQQGLTTATSTSQWLTEDWQNMEAWEYKVLAADTSKVDELENELNRLGAEGWECLSVNGKILIFKKRRNSYLRRLPFKDLLHLTPLLNQKQ